MSLHDRYKWTVQQVEETDLMYLFDLIVVQSKVNDDEREVFIDDII